MSNPDDKKWQFPKINFRIPLPSSISNLNPIPLAKKEGANILRKNILESIGKEFAVVRKEIAMKLPYVYSYEDPNFAAFCLQIPNEFRPVFFAMIKGYRTVRMVARAIRESILIAMKEMFSVAAALPLVNSIVSSVIDQLGQPVNPWNPDPEYIDALHKNIMLKFDKDGLDELLEFYSNQMGLIMPKGAQAFFILVMKPLQKKFHLIEEYHGFIGEISDEEIKTIEKNYSPQSKSILKALTDILAASSLEIVAGLVTGLLIAISGFLKVSILTAMMIPSIRKTIKAFFELQILRAYAATGKIKRLPRAVCEENKRYTIKNIFEGVKTFDERATIVAEYDARIKKEEDKRRLFRLRLD